MNNPLSRKITFFSVLKFTLPTIVMMMFMSFYTMIDGMFVSRLIGTSALSAVNIVYPLLNIVIALAIMLGTGGSAIIARRMGQGRTDEARAGFSLLVVVGIAIGFLILLVGILFLSPILRFLGANDAIYSYCYDYAVVLLAFVPFGVLQMMFQFFFVTAGKPQLGLISTIVGGVANIILDYAFIAIFDLGIAGAALATGIGFSVPALTGLIYFTANRKGTLYFVKPAFDLSVIAKSCTNGSSEMVTNLSAAITTFLFNIITMRYLGEDGVAAITIVLYAEYLFNAVFLGYSSGVAPMISYNYGNKNKLQMQRLFRLSYTFVACTSVLVFILSFFLSDVVVTFFAKPGSTVFLLAQNGFSLFSFGFLMMGLNIFTSALFTALSNGRVSAILSFFRSFLCLITSIFVLPQLLGINGIWLAVPVAEVFALAMAVFMVLGNRRRYEYM